MWYNGKMVSKWRATPLRVGIYRTRYERLTGERLPRYPEDLRQLRLKFAGLMHLPTDVLEDLWEAWSDSHGVQWLLVGAMSDVDWSRFMEWLLEEI